MYVKNVRMHITSQIIIFTTQRHIRNIRHRDLMPLITTIQVKYYFMYKNLLSKIYTIII